MGWLVPRLPTIRCLTSTFSFVLIWGGYRLSTSVFSLQNLLRIGYEKILLLTSLNFEGDHRDAIITGIRLGDDFFDKVFLHEQSNLARDSPFR